jgi:hypothetical protein
MATAPTRLGGFALVLLALLAGCGGGNSRESFVTDALAICGKANERVRALGTPESFTQTQLYARQAKDAVGDELDELRDLTPPPEFEDAFAAYLQTLERRHAQLGLLAGAADNTDINAVRQVGSELSVLTAKARTQARRAGIEECEPR